MSKWLRRMRGEFSQRGIALILVLMVVTVMTVLIMDLHQSVRIHFYIAGNLVAGVKSSYLVRSGVQVAAGALLADLQDNKVDHMHEDWYDFMGKLQMMGMPSLPIGDDGTVMLEINDEAGRFNLNSMISKNGQPRKIAIDVFRKLLEGAEIEPELATAVVDWIDNDEETMEGGGLEDQVYGYDQQGGALSKNGPFDSMQELRLVSGITDEVWNKLQPLVTVYGDQRMNLNTANESVMRAVIKTIDENADTSIVTKIVEWRKASSSEGEGEDGEESSGGSMFSAFGGGSGNYFKGKTMAKTLITDIGMDQVLARKFVRYFKDSSRYFRVNVTAIVGGVQKSAIGIIQRGKKKSSIIYYREAPGAAPNLGESEEDSQTATTTQQGTAYDQATGALQQLLGGQ